MWNRDGDLPVMTRTLKTSGFLGLTAMMLVGLYQTSILAGGNQVPGWMIGGHAHLGVLSILAIVVGFAVDAFGVAARLRQAVSGLFVVGQWGVPLAVWGAAITGIGALHALACVAGPALVVSMLIMAWQAATVDASFGTSAGAAPTADD